MKIIIDDNRIVFIHEAYKITHENKEGVETSRLIKLGLTNNQDLTIYCKNPNAKEVLWVYFNVNETIDLRKYPHLVEKVA